jgi:hypothetical protein
MPRIATPRPDRRTLGLVWKERPEIQAVRRLPSGTGQPQAVEATFEMVDPGGLDLPDRQDAD